MRKISSIIIIGLILALAAAGLISCGDSQEKEIISFHIPDIEEVTKTTAEEHTSSQKEETDEPEMTRASVHGPEDDTSTAEESTEISEEEETSSSETETTPEETPVTETTDTSATETEPSETQPPETQPTETSPQETAPAPQETTPEAVPTETTSETAPPPAETPPPARNWAEPLYASRDPYQLHAELAAYLTFDDGPSENTPYVLDVLDQYGVKACFFVTYHPEFEHLYREIVNRGHSIGVHTTSHRYNEIYASFENWYADFMQTYNYIIQVTGVTPALYRFPGGSNTNYASQELKTRIREFLHQNGVEYYDWNVSGEDAVGIDSPDYVREQALGDIRKRTVPVILMHDGETQKNTKYALPDILRTSLEWGFSFRPLDPYVPVIWQESRWDY